MMCDDIEIHISGHFEIDGEYWHEGWTDIDYRAHGFEEEKYFNIAGETVMDGIRYQTFGARIGLTTRYKYDILAFHLTENNKSVVFNNESGIYEYMSVHAKVNGKSIKYSHSFHENGNTDSFHWSERGDLITEKGIKYSSYYDENGLPSKKIYFNEDGAMIKYLKYRDGIPYEIMKNPNMDKSIYMDYEEQIFHFGKNISNCFDEDYIHDFNANYGDFPNMESSARDGMSVDDSSSTGSSDPFSLTIPCSES